MHIKKGDNVKVISGKDRGKTGKVLQVFPELDRLVVEGVNTATKHLAVRNEGEKGQKIEYNAPLRASNVMLVCPKCGAPTRVGLKLIEHEGGKGKKVRVCKKCKEAIE